jgi:diguanylate cyclase (GGDEF)-like protein/PAS domain S-box-containing protein
VERQQSHNTKRFKRGLGYLIVLTVIVFVVSFILQFVQKEQTKDVSRLLFSGGTQDLRILETRMQGSFYHLEALASMLSVGHSIPLESIRVSPDRQRLAFKTLSHVALDGTLLCGDPLPYEQSDLSGFGVGRISSVSSNGEPFLVLSVLVQARVLVDSALIGVYDFSTIMNIVSENSANPLATRFIVDSEGNLLSQIPFPDGSRQFLQFLSGVFTAEKIEELELDLRSRRLGFFDYTYEGTHFFLNYMPIINTNWSLVQMIFASDLPLYRSITGLRIALVVATLLLVFSIVVMLAILRWNNRSAIKSKHGELLRLPESIPGGSFTCKTEGDMPFIQISNEFVKLFGYSIDEFKKLFNNCFLQMVLDEDRDRVMEERRLQLLENRPSLIEYRVRGISGKQLWLADWTRLVDVPGGRQELHSLVLDVSGQREGQEEVRLSEERYRLIALQSRSAIFEWDLQKNIFYRSPNWKDIFGYTPIDNSANHIFAMERVHPDDQQTVANMFKACKEGKGDSEIEIRFMNSIGEFLWVRISFTIMFDEYGKPGRVIGHLFDIDKEVRERLHLNMLAQIDDLTGLLNKRTIEAAVDAFLKDAAPQDSHALCVIDIDNFKSINDTYGHLYGDSVLKKVSEQFLSRFNEQNCLIGRVGGDELLVFMKHICPDAYLDVKMDIFTTLFEKISNDMDGRTRISGSVGVALYPDHGHSYMDLFQKADKALYQVKSSGRNGVQIFNSQTDEGGVFLQ